MPEPPDIGRNCTYLCHVSQAVPIATGSIFASFATEVSPAVREAIREAEVLGLRGHSDTGLDRLAALVTNLEAGPEVTPDDDLVAIAEMTGMLRVWGGTEKVALQIFEACSTDRLQPGARGAVLLSRARSQADQYAELCTEALAEFAVAGDVRGQAVVLARLAAGMGGTGVAAYRLRLAREATDLAEELGDAWTLAFCRGHRAIVETYLGQPGVMDEWRSSVEVAVGRADSLAAHVASLNYHNWAFTALGFGEYELAETVLNEGRTTAYGAAWKTRFTTQLAWLRLRMGQLDAAKEATIAVALAEPERITDYHVAIAAAVSYERDRHLEFEALAEGLPAMMSLSAQVGSFAAGVLTRIRAARREPNAGRDAREALEHVRELGNSFGWEDAMLALAQTDLDAAAVEAKLMVDFWPTHARGRAMRSFVEGLLAREKGYDALVDAAAGLRALPEPVTAGQALHAAARVAPSIELGNQLRRQSIEIFERHGADRSKAAVVRDRTLSRGPGRHVPVPPGLAGTVTGGLTPREHEVAVLAAQGLTAAEIAEQLGVTVGTARNHLMKVREKFGGIPKRKLAQALGITPEP